MSLQNKPAVIGNIKKLILQLTNFEEDSEIFNHVYDHFHNALIRKHFPTLYDKAYINAKIAGFIEKLNFHGFLEEAEDAQHLYNIYIGSHPTEEELANKLAVMELLFCLSKSPTNYLANLPVRFSSSLARIQKEDIDWGTFLKDGCEWQPNFDDDALDINLGDDDDDADLDYYSELEATDSNLTITQSKSSQLFSSISPLGPYIDPKECYRVSFMDVLKDLQRNLSHTWFNREDVRDLSASKHPQANIALRWEKFVAKASAGMLQPRFKLLSEYKVMRETIFQLFSAHKSVVYTWKGDQLTIVDDVTIPSLRPIFFKGLMSLALSYIGKLHELRQFAEDVRENPQAPHTYKGYAVALMSIIHPATEKLVEVQRRLSENNCEFTMISLGIEIRRIFDFLPYLYALHRKVVLDLRQHPTHRCAMHLIAKLFAELYVVCTKQQLDICLTLYLEAVYKYVRIVEEWLRRGELHDALGEFPIAKGNEGEDGEEDEDEIYVVRSQEFADDPILNLLRSKVLQIGRHIRLFEALNRLHLLHATNFSIYVEWRKAVFESLGEFFEKRQEEEENAKDDDDGWISCGESDDDDNTEKHSRSKTIPWEAFTPSELGFTALVDGFETTIPGMPQNLCKYYTELDLPQYYLDDECMELFTSYNRPAGFYAAEQAKYATYKRLQEITTNNYPCIQAVISDHLLRIFMEQYRDSGRILKEVLVNEHNLSEHITLLGKIFLFDGDEIFPFYRRVFERIENQHAHWGNDIWLTYDLHDVLMDRHPKLYANAKVTVRDGWQELLEDPLRTCTLVKVNYDIRWPINIIAGERTTKMYKELFYFVLKVKWALYTLHHLNLSPAERKRHQRTAPLAVRNLLHRLALLRFGYVNVFTAVQHYILGYAFRVYQKRFKEAYSEAEDLESLVEAHEAFVNGYHRAAARVRDYKEQGYGVSRALYGVRQLRRMWMAPGELRQRDLAKAEEALRVCSRNVFEVIADPIYD